MCDYEDMPLTSKHTRQQAIDDGKLVGVLSWNGRPVMATTEITDDFGLDELLKIWHKFLAWKDTEEQNLPAEERLFSIKMHDRKIWVIEDGGAYTILYPDQY